MSDNGHFSFYEGHKEGRTGKIHRAFSGCWLARRLHQLKASTMDLRISVFLILYDVWPRETWTC